MSDPTILSGSSLNTFIECLDQDQLREASVALLFWSKVDKGGECWLWTGYKNGRGSQYGVFHRTKAHRFAWESLFGPIPTGTKILHTCDNTLCVRPAHLTPGTQKENMADMIRKGRSRPHGKRPLTEDQIRAIAIATGRQVDIAKQFGITQAHVSRIKRTPNG